MTQQNPFYATTAILPERAPHIGHAYEAIAADTLVRFKRLDGFAPGSRPARTSTEKMQQTAQMLDTTPRELADANSARFREMDDELASPTTASSAPRTRTTPRPRRSCGSGWRPTGTSTRTRTPGGTPCGTRPTTPKDETEVRADGQRDD
ncbi:class I tRNA ligase family protein [Kocuria rhizophila]|nr:class I tRNA ligase family protein [Kocuria rhizophila]